jgi:hypothetical protein
MVEPRAPGSGGKAGQGERVAYIDASVCTHRQLSRVCELQRP